MQAERGKRRRLYVLMGLGVLVGMVLGGAFLFGVFDSGPSYKGKPASAWIRQLMHSSASLTAGTPLRIQHKWLKRQEQAKEALVQIGKPAVSRMVALLEEKRSFSAELYEKLYYLAPQSIQDHLDPPQSIQKTILIRTLGELGTVAREAQPLLKKKFQVSGPQDKVMIASALVRIDPTEKEALDYLIGQVSGRGDPLAIHQLAEIGRPAKEALPTLNNLFYNGTEMDKMRAVSAIKAIGGSLPQAIEMLKRAASDPSKQVRKQAKRALQSLETTPKR